MSSTECWKEMMRMTKASLLPLLALAISLSVMILGCSHQISEAEALESAKAFVDSNIRFYTTNQTAQGVVPQDLEMRTVEISKLGSEWQIKLAVSTNSSGELKQKGLIVVVDAQTGEVKPDQLSYFNLE